MNLMAITDATLSPTFSSFEFDAPTASSIDFKMQEIPSQHLFKEENPFGVQDHEDSAMPMVMEDDFDYGADETTNQWEQVDPVQEALAKAAANVLVDDEEEYEVEESEFASIQSQNYLMHMDEKIGQNWAGPQHWKIRRVGPLMPVKPKTSAPKSQKTLTKVDFAEASPDISSLFAKSNNAGTITIGKNIVVDRSNTHFLLPEDVHFSSLDLLKLFLKPQYKLGQTQRTKVKRRLVATTNEPDVRDGAEFWAQQEEIALHPEHDYNETAVNNFPDGDDYEYEDVSPVTLIPSVVIPEQPEGLNYARRARRIDVQLLKERMWGNISKQMPKGTISFDSVIQNTKQVFEKDTMLAPDEKELSVAYCFICLLHLANENSLGLRSLSDVSTPAELMIVKN